MNTGLQFKHYVWLVNILSKGRRLTLKELQEEWVQSEEAEGNPLPRSSFNKYRDIISDMFGLNIECDMNYRYYISNPHELEGDLTKQWMLSTLTTGLTLTNSSAIKDDIILENVPAGYEFLPVIMQAIRSSASTPIRSPSTPMPCGCFASGGTCWPTITSAWPFTRWTVCFRPR